jgi:hypothetical protein
MGEQGRNARASTDVAGSGWWRRRVSSSSKEAAERRERWVDRGQGKGKRRGRIGVGWGHET